MDKLNQLLQIFYHHQIVLKTFHFQTTSYAAHKASDAYLEKFATNMDRFMEVAQGVYGRVTLKEIDMKVQVGKDISCNVKDMVKVLSVGSGFYQNNTDLLAIRDEMLADANQLLYLLTFE